ncbi:hypothetical protein PN441_09985 [Spirulina major CS-329]|uniref:hypothetical protein n=1 Tax=Spirulina TaxID=1154 RepID=UPI00232D4B49|nr:MULTISPECIES: hypothetical protein [Spirulina]MDB9494728.1 hypothetical protein [Spirulina subsalsa CS-330]MDB9503400.1 hypothetical protein [Spirulina major CS-329]
MALTLEQIQAEINALPPQDIAYLREWLIAQDWQQWDQQIEADSNSGKLDFLFAEAMDAKKTGTLEDL